MKKEALLVVLLLMPVAFAEEEFVFADSATLKHEIYSSFIVSPEKSDYSLDYIIVNLSFYPKNNFQQEVLELNTIPAADETGNHLIFTFENTKTAGGYKISAIVRTTNKRMEVREKINFPIGPVHSSLKEFTEPSELIDSDDPRIVGLASQIVEGQDDLFVAVAKLGEWTKTNIEYNISTLTESASQRASWVLSHRKGVCDELTNLFMAFNRALGIPARFVSGISYTASEHVAEQWGPHGWAEVYFPDTGWIPFDMTYGQFGYVDSAHIVSGMTRDSTETATQLYWYGSDVDVDFEKLKFATEMIDYSGKTDFVKITASPVKQTVGFGSYNIIEAVVENINDYYVCANVGISKIMEIENVDEVEKTVVLMPGEKKSVFWLVRVRDDLSRSYVYSFPLLVYTADETSGETIFKSDADAEVMEMAEAVTMLKSMKEESEKRYSREVIVECSPEKESYYDYENKTINCLVENRGNVFLQGLSACIEADCGVFDLGITQKKGISFDVEAEKSKKVEVVVSNEEVLKKAFVQLEVFDAPKIVVENLAYPKNVSYGEDFRVSFAVKKLSASVPKKTKVKFIFEDSAKEWDLNDLEADKRIVVEMNGRQLDTKPNLFRINVEHYDLNEIKYDETAELRIELNKLKFFQKISMFFRKISRSFNKVFK